MMTVDMTPIVEAVIALAAAILTAYAIPWLKRRLGNEQFNILASWVAIAVRAAEGIFNYPDAGKEKYDYVTEFISSLNIPADDKTLSNLIEAEVYSLKAGDKNA